VTPTGIASGWSNGTDGLAEQSLDERGQRLEQAAADVAPARRAGDVDAVLADALADAAVRVSASGRDIRDSY
jgi:hypothetical protein